MVGVLLLGGASLLAGEEIGPIRSISLTQSNRLRLVIQPAGSETDLILQSADSPLGPWRAETDFARTPVGSAYEYLTQQRSYYPHRFYRFSRFSYSPQLAQGLPYIRFIAPNSYLAQGQRFTLFGANFASNPSENTVTFELLTRSWPATVLQASTNYLIGIVPTNLIVSSTSSTGMLYRVSLRTARGAGNGVGCTIDNSVGSGSFSIRPDTVYLVQSPGSGKQTMVVGGGTPPYKLVPQSAADLEKAVATLNGPVLEVTANPKADWGSIYITVEDSNTNYVWQARASVGVLTIPYSPKLEATFHTLQAGTAPGVTIKATLSDSSDGNFETDRLELHLQNAKIELGHVHPGAVAGLLELADPGYAVYGYQHLVIKEVSGGRARFDVVSLANNAATVTAKGELIENPPTVIVDLLDLNPAALVPQPVTLTLLFPDQIFRLPSSGGESFTMRANFTSVSAREDVYLPQTCSVTNRYVTTDLASGGPRIDRLVPVHGEIYRIVRVQGSFSDAASTTDVSFAGVDGERVAAEILSRTANEMVVVVPPGAVSGPVRVRSGGQVSNDFAFYVRFHPDTVLLVEGAGANTPAGLRLLHQQPVDDDETIGEISLRSALCTLGGGHMAVSELSPGQKVGNVITTSFYQGRKSTNDLLYAGQESTPPQRHIFQQKISKYVLATLYYSETAQGVTLELASGEGWFGMAPGGLYEFEFTTPIYTPPSNQDVPVRVEAISQPWTSIPGNEMHVIWNSIWHAP